MAEIDQEVARLLAAAAAARKRGDGREEVRLLDAALAIEPEQPVALNARGMRALADKDAAGATAWFRRAASADPGEPALWMNLASAQRALDDAEGERDSLYRALAIDRTHFMAMLRTAELHERLGEEALALQAWQNVVAVRPLIDRTTPELDTMFAHARAYVDARVAILSDRLETALAAPRAAVGKDRLRRFNACVEASLGRRRIYTNQCHGLHYPFLPADEFFARDHFPWMEMLESKTDAIRAELVQLLEAGADGMQPYVQQDSGTPSNKWSDLDHSERWSAFFLWRHGVRVDEACARCPETAALLDALPLSDIPGRSPTAFFSLLHPGTRIPPHTGVTNARAIVHLPLIVPDKCGFRVGGETRPWNEGEAFAFDDTIEHEAWNESRELRAVLILDVWNPHIDEDERTLLRAYFEESIASGLSPNPDDATD